MYVVRIKINNLLREREALEIVAADVVVEEVLQVLGLGLLFFLVGVVSLY